VVTCSIQHYCRRPGCLLQVPNCLSPVVTWLRDVGLGGQKQPDPYARHGQRESVSSDLQLHLWTAAVRGWRLPRSWQIHTRGCQVFAFGSSHEKPPVQLYQHSIVSMFQKHMAVMTGHTNCWRWVSPPPVFWIFMEQGKIMEAEVPTVRVGATPTRLTAPPPPHPPNILN